MALAFIYSLQNLWPLSRFKFDDLRASDELVKKLPIPESTKRFVFAARDPESQSVIYLLCAQNLSERSALDSECLIRAVRPEAVVVQLGSSELGEILSEESELGSDVRDFVPTSSFEVLKRCFLDKVGKEKYENVAGSLVLREIFGVGFHEHVLIAKKAAKEVGSSFLLLETPFGRTSTSGEVDAGSELQVTANSLVPQKAGSFVSSRSRRFFLTDDVQSRMVKLLSSHMDATVPKLSVSSSVSEAPLQEVQPLSTFQAPPFAQSIYPLLVDLHDIFNDIPSIGRALAFSQKMLYAVNRGEVIDTQTMSEVYTFRVAVEGLRIALNNVGRLPIKESERRGANFSELSTEDKSYMLLARALQSQTKKFKNVVAVVDASGLAGLRKHWRTPLPAEVKDLVEQLVTDCGSDGEVSEYSKWKGLFSSKPVVAVGAGATAAFGVSSISKFVPATTFVKIMTFKLPASVKLMLTQTQKVTALALGKTIGPSKLAAPVLANPGANATSIWKAAASAEKIRTVTHSVIASAEKTSFSAMRTAFYEIMRKREIVQSIGFLPWATFGASVATCSALLMYGDGIECAVESLPAAPSIASLGRGIQSLRQASLELGRTDSSRIQKSIESLMHRLRKVKTQ